MFMYNRLYQPRYVTEKVEAAQQSIKRKFEELSKLKISTKQDGELKAYDMLMTTLEKKFKAEDTSR